jgi:hypothetical protein
MREQDSKTKKRLREKYSFRYPAHNCQMKTAIKEANIGLVAEIAIVPRFIGGFWILLQIWKNL